MTTDDKLKPCPNPWCEALEYGNDFPPVMQNGNFGTHFIYCTSCTQKGPLRQTEAEAITAWNQRATDTQVSKRSELADRLHLAAIDAIHDDATTAITDAIERIAVLEAENFALAAGSCDVPNGKIGDEHGNFYCSLQRRQAPDAQVSSLVSALERLYNSIDSNATLTPEVLKQARAALDGVGSKSDA